ncbi:MAG: XdhC family protein [Melioribacteraceae bacterium]|nr:XdhC family protein [Melioribacteraceae bacterium]
MEIMKKAGELIETNSTFVMATVVESKGSSPGKPGFKMLILPDKKTMGTVGGGAIEVKVKEDAICLMNLGENKLKEYYLNSNREVINNGAEIVPMACNGEMKVYYETFGKTPNVFVFGGGHVGQALIKILSGIGYYVVLIDNREEYADKNTNPLANKIILNDYQKYADEFEPPENSFVLLLTHGHKYDYEVLRTLILRKLKLKYIGVIGSKSKAAKMRKDLKKDLSFTFDESIIHSPIGLKIGGDSAAEIAISIAAEMQAVRYGQEKNFG